MIETTGMLFAFAMIPFGLDFFEARVPLRSVCFFTVFGVLACLQKVTTGSPVIIVTASGWLIYWFFRGESRLPPVGNLLAGITPFGVPLLPALLWAQPADGVKQAQSLGVDFTSDALPSWA